MIFRLLFVIMTVDAYFCLNSWIHVVGSPICAKRENRTYLSHRFIEYLLLNIFSFALNRVN